MKKAWIFLAVAGCLAMSGAHAQDEGETRPFRGPIDPDRPLARGYNDAAAALAGVDENPLIAWTHRVWCVTGYRSPEDAGTGQAVDDPVNPERDYVSPLGFFHSAGAYRLMPSGGARFLDNAWYFGADGLGAIVVRTPSGLVLVDTMGRPEDFERVVLAEMPAAGLDPRDITHVFIGHYHWDHTGGVNRIREIAPDVQVIVGGPDARLIETARNALLEGGMPDDALVQKAVLDRNARAETPEAAAELNALRLAAIPERFDVLVEADPGLTTGVLTVPVGEQTEVTAVLNPGHTPGQMSVIVPVEHRGEMHNLLVISGNDNPQEAAQYALSMDYLRAIAAQRGADVLINTHGYQGAMFYHLRQLIDDPDGPNPFLMGRDGVDRFLGVFANCQRATFNRLHDGTWDAF
ncbi:MAG: MBL fold metallo-hydrolase [Pseudomonadota bacterium]|nr:MBL fold metallo-hydrolase [Pseudomonadota bacterium]